MHGIKVLMAKNYIDNLSEKAFKSLAGKFDSASGSPSAPFDGLKVFGENGKRIIETDPASDLEPASIVNQMLEWCATRRYSLRDITCKSREHGLAFRSSGGPMAQSSVCQMLRNPIYMGDFDQIRPFRPRTISSQARRLSPSPLFWLEDKGMDEKFGKIISVKPSNNMRNACLINSPGRKFPGMLITKNLPM